MKTAASLRVLVIIGSIAGTACGTDPNSPSGPCAQDEETAALLYGPPLAVSHVPDTTTYTWGGGEVLFIAQGSACVEESGTPGSVP